MSKIIPKLRVIILVAIIIIALVLSLVRLMKLQIVKGEEYLSQSVKRTIGTQAITAPRGEIVDVNGNPIVKNEAGFNVIIQKAFFPKDYKEQNDIIMKVINILKSQNTSWVDTLPITTTYPLEYLQDKDNEISKVKDILRLNTYATAENCVDELIKNYEISDEYSDIEKRLIAGIRYQMLATEFSISNDYIFAENVSDKAVAKISELSYLIDGITIKETPVRVYIDGTVLAHSIGTIGPIYAEEYAELKEKGYGFNDKIGKSGVEKAMESVLRGQDGLKSIAIGSDDNDVEINVEEPATAGNTVRLTIDAEFQKKCQDILADTILKLREQPEPEGKYNGKYAKGGAIVVLDAKTGAVRSLASFPSYDINDYLENYSKIANEEYSPLIDRAINGSYRPGSTFKPITAITLLNEGLVTPETEFYCSGEYKYGMGCWKDTGHGDINVINAITESCNIYFYKAVGLTDIDTLLSYEKQFGLATQSTLEIGGATGHLASPEEVEKTGNSWGDGQFIQAAIGQSEISVTPLQMAEEALTIANRGVRYNPYIIDSVWDYNQKTKISETSPVIANTIEIKEDEVFEPVIEGMIGAAEKKTPGLSGLFPREEYSLHDTLPKQAAIKTGSPQMTKDITSSSFIGFYPADDPEIAFSGYIEYGEYSKYMIRKIIDAYYEYDNEDDENIEGKSAQDIEEATQEQ